MKKILYYIIILISLISYSFASYNFDKITQFENVLDIYLLENKLTQQNIENILKQNENILNIVAISKEDFVNISNKYNTIEKSKLLKVFGEPKKLFFKGQLFSKPNFKDNSIYISNTLAENIFKMDNVLGKKLFINGKEYTIYGIFEDSKPIAIVKSNNEDIFYNIKVFFDKNKNIDLNINNFIKSINFSKVYIDNFYMKINFIYFLLQLPKILTLFLVIYLFYRVFTFDNKFSIRTIFYQLIGVTTIIILYFILNINIYVPLSLINNNWSDFNLYKNLFINFIHNLKNYMKIDKSLFFITIDKYIFYIITSLLICISGIIYFFKKSYEKRKKR